MRKEIFNYFERAGKLTAAQKRGRAFLIGAVAVRYDGAIVSAINSASEIPNRLLHAEYRLAKKLDVGSTVYVARVRLLDGEFGLSRPCWDCEKILKSKGVRKIFYTIDHEGGYGVMNLETGKEYEVKRKMSSSDVSVIDPALIPLLGKDHQVKDKRASHS